MKLDRWRTLLDSAGPFASITIDTTRSDESGGSEVRLRWEAAAKHLSAAPGEVIETAGQAVLEHHKGAAGRFVVVSADGKLLVDEVLPVAPPTSTATWGPAVHLLPVLRAFAHSVPYILVKIDRSGADVEVHGDVDEPVETTTVAGSNDVLHKAGGRGHWRYEHRAEDSWERNATEVAHAVAKLEREHRPAVVLLAGDDRAVGAFLEHAGAEVHGLAVKLETGGRAEGISEAALEEAVTEKLAAQRKKTQQQLVDRYQQGEGRQDNAVQGLADVVDALRRSQVEEVLLHDDPSSTLHLWVGEQPLLIGLTESDVRAIGAEHPQRVRADAALAWAALGSDAGITLLEDDKPNLEDGIAAVLRWSDRSTPKESLPSMPGHGEARGGEPVA